MLVLQKLAKARSLPPGHVDFKKAVDAVDREYKACHAQEDLWARRNLKKKEHGFESRQAERLVREVCESLGERRVPCLVFQSPRILPEASAHCNSAKKELHFRWKRAATPTILHELTHFVSREHVHGRAFCEMEALVLDAALQVLKYWRAQECGY